MKTNIGAQSIVYMDGNELGIAFDNVSAFTGELDAPSIAGQLTSKGTIAPSVSDHMGPQGCDAIDRDPEADIDTILAAEGIDL